MRSLPHALGRDSGLNQWADEVFWALSVGGEDRRIVHVPEGLCARGFGGREGGRVLQRRLLLCFLSMFCLGAPRRDLQRSARALLASGYPEPESPRFLIALGMSL